MTKCFWCESTYQTEKQALADNPKVSLHWKCFWEIMRIHDKIEIATKYLEGRLPFLAKNGNKVGYDTIELCLQSMDNFDKRWEKKMAMIKEISSINTKISEN